MDIENNYRFIHLLYVPTMACNMACKYCYLEDNTKDEWYNTKPLDTLEYAVNKFFKSNIIPFNISLHGGEVTTLSKKDFGEIIEYISNYYKDNRMLIESNGFKIGSPHIKTNLYDIDKHIETIKKYNVSISGSIDLPLKLHDEYRVTKNNEKTLDKILENIKLLELLPNKKKVSATIFKEHFNLDEIIKDIKYLHEETCLDMNDFNFMIGFDYNSNGLLHHISEEEQLELFNKMKETFINTELEEGLKNAWFQEFGPGYCTNCSNCGEKFFLLEKNGDIYSCVRGQKQRNFYYGNIYNNSPEEIMKTAFDKIYEAHNKLPFNEECSKCKYLYLCKTGCPFVKNTYNTNKSYTCKLQQELYKYWGYDKDIDNKETVYNYVSKMHQDEIIKYYPEQKTTDHKDLDELIEEDEKLKYIYDSNCFILKVEDEEYNLSSQILKGIRQIIYINEKTEINLYIKNDLLDQVCDYPNNNALYMMLLSGDTIKYGDEKRTKQAHIMTHQIYKGVLEQNKSDKMGYFKVNINTILKNYYKYLSKTNPSNLFFTTTSLRDYHYTKQKNNAYYHIDSINLPFQNIEFYLIGGRTNVEEKSRNI